MPDEPDEMDGWNPDDERHPLPADPTYPNDDSIVIEIEEDFGITPPQRPTSSLPRNVVALVRRQRMLSVNDIMNLPPIEWFIEGLLPAGPTTVMHGKGGTRKSFIMLDWMLTADQSKTWHGHWVRPGKCLYMAGEGVQGLSKRIRAWCAVNEVSPDDLSIDFMAIPLNLFTLKSEQVDNWAQLIVALGYDYVVVDTLHTASSGADENSSQDIGTVYENARHIAGNAQLFYLHHDPKQGKSARGSSSIRDDADVVIEIERDGNLQLTSTMKADKIKDADEFMPVHIHFEVYGDGLASSLFIKGIGHDDDPGAMQGKGQRIVNILQDQPGRTKNEVAKLLGTNNGIAATFERLKGAGEIWSKTGERTEADGKLHKRELWYTKDTEEEDTDDDAD